MPDPNYVERAVCFANINALRMALFQATRDPEIGAVAAQRLLRGGSEVVEISATDADLIRRKAVEFLTSLPEEGKGGPVPRDVSVAEREELVQMAEARQIAPSELDMRRWLPDFAEFQFEANWNGANQVPEGFSVAIIGGGFAGVAMAIQLERLEIPYVLFERRHEVGGVWSINTYPDARVDTPSASYQFGFEKHYPWTEYFARQGEVRGYLEHVARTWGVWDHLRFGHDVREARFDDADQLWRLTLTTADGETVEHQASAVVTATGVFATPRSLDVPGMDSFEGQVAHTTRWSESLEYAGKKVAVIGNGSTGVQLLSSIAAVAESVVVCQRTPQWIMPRPGYGDPVQPELQWLLRTMPFYWEWNKYVTGMGNCELYKLLLIDDEWIDQGGLVNERNDALRAVLKDYLATQVGHDEELIAQLTPDYPPMTRRPVVDNGWYSSLTRDNVELIPGSVERFDNHGIHLTDGRYREIDVVVTAVGFDTQRYLWPTAYYGSNGASLEEAWRDEGAKAYLGMTVPDFPNLFMLYGPNSQPVASATGQPGWYEIWTRYIAQALVDMIEAGHRAMSVRKDVFESYNDLIDKEAARMVYMLQDSALKKNYYVNDHGRLQVQVPFTGEHFYSLLAEPNLSDFDVLRDTPDGGVQ